MLTLRCTKKLLLRLGSVPDTREVEPTTRLGDWYANLLHRRGGQVVLFVNERSLLPVLVPAAPAKTLLSRFQAATAELLTSLGVAAAVVDAERREMDEVHIGKTRSRQVLGSMTDFAFLMEGYTRDTIDLSEIAMKLADAPCGPLGMKRPADAAIGVLTLSK